MGRRATPAILAIVAALTFVGLRATPTHATPPPAGTFVSYKPIVTATSIDPTHPTPAIAPTLGTGGIGYGRYTRIGDVVTVHFSIIFGSGATPGSGAYRINLPVPIDNTERMRQSAIGYGLEHEESQGHLGLGPGAYRTVIYHVNNNVDQHHAGIVIGENPRAATPDDPSVNLSPMFDDVQTDQTSDSNPWVWAAGDQLTGDFTYEAAH